MPTCPTCNGTRIVYRENVRFFPPRPTRMPPIPTPCPDCPSDGDSEGPRP